MILESFIVYYQSTFFPSRKFHNSSQLVLCQEPTFSLYCLGDSNITPQTYRAYPISLNYQQASVTALSNALIVLILYFQVQSLLIHPNKLMLEKFSPKVLPMKFRHLNGTSSFSSHNQKL
jgi:hypothetical protein